MNWQRYKILIIVGAVSLLLGAGMLVWFLQGRGREAELRMEISSLAGQRDSLAQQRPFPSQASFEQQQRLKQEMEGHRDTLRQTILAGQLTPPDMNRARFGDYIRNTLVPPLQELAAASTLGGENGVILADPTFGLQSFMDGALPEPGDIPALMVRLELMRHLAGLLFSSGISELQAIGREAPAAGRSAPGRPAAPAAPVFGSPATPPGAPRPGARPPEVSPEERLVQKRDEMFEAVPFTLRFRVYEDKFANVLNAFAADPNQIVIRRLEVTNGNERLHPAYLRRPGSPQPQRPTAARRPASEWEQRLWEAGGPAGAAEPAAATPLPGLAERRARLTGGEFLDVSMDIVIYRLKPLQGS